jgi:hypothetical protein
MWCGFWAQGIIGSFFFEDSSGNSVTVNGECYRNMISSFLWKELEGLDISNCYFQQDDATCHTSGETIRLLQTKFPGRVISKNENINWPPRSYDLTPLDFYLWGDIKQKVYANNPQTIEELKENIRVTIHEIQPDL